MPGPPKKPTKMKILEGNPGGKRIPKDELEPRPSMPDAPAHLDDDGKSEWYRICEGLHYMGILSEDDRNALAAYCSSYSLWAQSWRAIKGMQKEGVLGSGLMIKTTNGNMIQNPLVGTANSAARDMVKYAAEFGLTPAARAKISMNPQGPQKKKGIQGLIYGGKKANG